MGAVKVKEVDLERGMPTVDAAVRTMVDQLGTCKRTGFRAVILVHGYGSSGVGGKIKAAVSAALREPRLSGLVRETCPGERWADGKRDFLSTCPQLRDHEVRIAGNQGVTVVLLK